MLSLGLKRLPSRSASAANHLTILLPSGRVLGRNTGHQPKRARTMAPSIYLMSPQRCGRIQHVEVVRRPVLTRPRIPNGLPYIPSCRRMTHRQGPSLCLTTPVRMRRGYSSPWKTTLSAASSHSPASIRRSWVGANECPRGMSVLPRKATRPPRPPSPEETQVRRNHRYATWILSCFSSEISQRMAPGGPGVKLMFVRLTPTRGRRMTLHLTST
jgi:hypothetical protein